MGLNYKEKHGNESEFSSYWFPLTKKKTGLGEAHENVKGNSKALVLELGRGGGGGDDTQVQRTLIPCTPVYFINILCIYLIKTIRETKDLFPVLKELKTL